MTSEHKPRYTGQCLCGSIKYEVDAIEPKMGHCHCSMCRKFHGAAFATFGEARKNNFRWVKGEKLLKDYVADNGSTRQFCSQCGSSLTFSSADNPENVVEFTLGTLDTDLDIKPDAHIYVGSKTSWYVISDDLPQFKASRQKRPL